MTTPIPWPAGGTPYVVPAGNALQSWPVGVDWTTIPPGTNITTTQNQSALAQVCLAATADVNGALNYTLHAAQETEQVQGPAFRVTYRRDTGEARIILSRWPVTSIASVQVAPAGVYPYQWTVLPAGFYRPEYPVIGSYGSAIPSGSGEGGQAILIAPGYLDWSRGRNGFVVQVTYFHGWPHTHLTANAVAGAASIAVADCSAWGPFTTGAAGAVGIIYDNSAASGQEPVTCTASSVATGPGTLTLSSPLGYAHAAGIMVSALPPNTIWATALFAGAQALTRGARATTVQATPGRRAGATGADDLRKEAESILAPFKRTW